MPRQRLATTDPTRTLSDDYLCCILAAFPHSQILFNDIQYVHGVLVNGANFAAISIDNIFEMTRGTMPCGSEVFMMMRFESIWR